MSEIILPLTNDLREILKLLPTALIQRKTKKDLERSAAATHQQLIEKLGPMLQQHLPPAEYREMMEESAKSNLECQKQKLIQLQEQEKLVKAFDKKVMKLKFSQVLPPQPVHEDCGICFCRVPSKLFASIFLPCCGKIICRACFARSMQSMEDWKGPITSTFGSDTSICRQNCSFCRQVSLSRFSFS